MPLVFLILLEAGWELSLPRCWVALVPTFITKGRQQLALMGICFHQHLRQQGLP